MDAIVPVTITEEMLISSTVAETDTTEWTSGDTFDLGEQCMVTSTTASGGPASAPYLSTHRGNFIDGNAFVEINSTDLSRFVGTDGGSTPYKITLTDAASKTIVGYIGASGAGRLLSSEMVTNGTFETTPAGVYWTRQTGWTVTGGGDLFLRSANGLLAYQDVGLAANQLYYAGLTIDARTSGNVALFYGAGTNYFNLRASVATFLEYAMSDGTAGTFGVNGFGASVLDVDNVTCKQVLEPVVAASGGLHIVSELNGSSRGWSTTEGDGLAGGFNPRTIVSYAITAAVGYHRIYESLEAANLGNFPPTSPTKWVEVGATNRWRVFDNRIQDQASQAASMQWVIEPGPIDSIALYNLDADSVTLYMEGNSNLITNGADWTGATGTTQPNSWSKHPSTPSATYLIDTGTLKMTSEASGNTICQAVTCVVGKKYIASASLKNGTCAFGIGIGVGPTAYSIDIGYGIEGGGAFVTHSVNFTATATVVYVSIFNSSNANGQYGWVDTVTCCEVCDETIVIVDVTEIAKTDLPTATDPQLTITITKNGTPACGEIVVGNKYNLGTTRPEPSVGITDYSIKEADTFGNYFITQRAYSSRNDVSTLIDNTYVDAIFTFLAENRATPLAWIASELYSTLILYGFYKDFEIRMFSPHFSSLETSIEGLT